MKYYSPETKTFKLLKALQKGDRITPAAARNRFNIANLSAEVSRIRQLGYAVHRATRVAGNYTKVVEYFIGEPSREIIALGYKAKSSGMKI